LKPAPTPRPLVVLLGLLIALPALGTDVFVPALPVLTAALGAEVGAAQLTMTLYFIGLAAGQLLWGPLSDRYGRKPILMSGLAIMLAASLAAALAESLTAVIAARLAQGLGMSSGALIGRTIVRDLYTHEAAAKLLSSMSIVFSMVPIAAPLAGGVLADTAGWRSVFVALLITAAALAVAVLSLAETAPAARASANPARIMRTFGAILSDRRFLTPYSVFLCTQIAILAWVSNSSFTLISGLGVGPTAYGAMFTLVMCGQIAGAWFSSRLVLRLGIARMLRAGAALMLAGSASAAALAWSGVGHWAAVVAPFVMVLFGAALIVPNATAAAMAPFPGAAGAVAALIGTIGFTAGALISSALGAAFDGTARPMATAAALAGAGAFLLERITRHGKA
jgi:DHA1 family bicyclomycin/chloramphenicol resistance-like MFS transporter